MSTNLEQDEIWVREYTELFMSEKGTKAYVTALFAWHMCQQYGPGRIMQTDPQTLLDSMLLNWDEIVEEFQKRIEPLP
jgi:hypothetical protein